MPSILSVSLTGVCLCALSAPAFAQTASPAPVAPAQATVGSADSSSGASTDSATTGSVSTTASADSTATTTSTISTNIGAGNTAPQSSGGFFTRLANYYASEWGKAGPAPDPNAPSSRRDYFPPQPTTTPPIPFTEWPYGGSESIGANRPNSVDSPLMQALAPTSLGEAMSNAHIQAYGWVAVGGNWSTNTVKGGNAPAGYDFDPRNVQLDQAVLYIERTPDTVQQDHVDWGFRVSGIYGVDYRYTTSIGLLSNQLLRHNSMYGLDLPMMYGEIYIPKVAQGLFIRVGRFISIPDIEAQLAPNNYMYSHSLGYTFDNFTNTGIMATLAVTKNLFVQAGIVAGTESAFWNLGQRVHNPFPNPLYPGNSYLKDPGSKPSFSGCIRYETDSARTDVYFCANGINGGVWGYNNLNWVGMTFYHKFTDKLHISTEFYNLYQKNVANIDNPVVNNIIAQGGTPFSPQNIPFNAPDGAHCGNATALKCTAAAQAAISYLNYQFSPLNNLSLRTEYYDDDKGQRTGTKTRYMDIGLGLQHFFSPQLEIRPEVTYYKSFNAPAFNGNSNLGIAPDKSYAVIVSGDVIMHF